MIRHNYEGMQGKVSEFLLAFKNQLRHPIRNARYPQPMWPNGRPV